MIASEPLPHFVDDLLGYLHETHPTHATLDGVHTHDDLLEDVSRHGIDSEAHALAGYLRRLDEINRDALTAVERLEHRMLTAHLQSRMFDLEAVRTWERNPQFYSDLLATSLAGQTLFTHAPAAERARRVLSKLRQTPRLIQAARDNIKDAPGIFVKVGIEAMRGTLKFIDEDLPRAFCRRRRPAPARRSRRRAERSVAGGRAVHRVSRDRAGAQGARPRSASAATSSSRSCGSTKACRCRSIACWRSPRASCRRRRTSSASLAGKMNGGDPIASWQKTKAQHPAPGQLVATGRQQLDELATFLERQKIISLPSGEPIAVAPTPDFYRWSFASMWTAGPFESKPSRAYYYLTDVDPSWGADRQDEHLRDYNIPTLWSISIHEVYPGHFLHYQHLRKVESKARKSIMFAPASFIEGWAHYCEQMMIEAGFGRQDPSIKLGQLAEALIRLVRFIVCIKLHAEDMSVEQGVRYFRDEAFWKRQARGARPSAARSIRRISSTPSAS